MKICPNCGTELSDSAAFCSYCGTQVGATDSFSQGAFSGQAQYQEAPQAQAQYQEAPQPLYQESQQAQPIVGFDPNKYDSDVTKGATPFYTFHDNMAADYSRDSGLVTAIKVFMILGCINSFMWGFVPLIWRIPMTIHAFKKFENNEAMGTGFKVCSLLFTNLVAGILMFIIKDEDMPFQR